MGHRPQLVTNYQLRITNHLNKKTTLPFEENTRITAYCFA